MRPVQVFPIVQSYKFKSKSQHTHALCTDRAGVSDSSKLQIQKQITTRNCAAILDKRCFRQFKVTNSKANHNLATQSVYDAYGVSDSSKLQIQKQITTIMTFLPLFSWVFPIVQIQKQITTLFVSQTQRMGCFRQFKVTNSKANHNHPSVRAPPRRWCFRQFKVTNSKANHNEHRCVNCSFWVFPIVQSYKFKSKSQQD